MLTPEQRKTLLDIARNAIAAALDGRPAPLDLQSLDETLRRPSGCFVSLHTKSGGLRGCVGSIQPIAPLGQAVASSALNAAFRDPRFHPLRKDELASIGIEISVMGPLERAQPDEIVVGRDGLVVRRGRYAGLLLPQVATQHGWDRDTFLEHTCIKAGLPPEAWKTMECTIQRFSAEVFGEENLHA